MQLRPILALVALAALAACADGRTAPEALLAPSAPSLAADGAQRHVTAAADAGAGSLRAAIEAANADASIRVIHVRRGLGAVTLLSPLVYTGAQPLVILGSGLVLDGGALAEGEAARDAALVASGGGDLTVRDLVVRNSTGNGIIVDVPDDRQGTMIVAFEDVTVEGSVRHGAIVNDQVDYFADPFTAATGGSPADLQVRVVRSRFVNNGFGGLDYDGLRVNEGGLGSLHASIAHSRFAGNGADGVELDERGDGSVRFVVRHTAIDANGYFTAEDWDDGIDVDEQGAGDLEGEFVQVTALGNAEQGVDLNENGTGDLRVRMSQVTANDNAEEGIEFEEDDDFEDFPLEVWGGDLIAELSNVTTNRNGANDGDAGLKLREKFTGDLRARVVNATAHDNAVSGIQLREGQGGSMTGELVRGSVVGNADAGVSLRGNGAVTTVALTAAGNGDGAVVAEAGVVVTQLP